MILSFGEMSIGNLPDGKVEISKITDSDAAALISSAKKLIGLHDFGAVPNKRKEKTFYEILSAIEVRLGKAVDPEVFFTKSGEDIFPFPPQLIQIESDRPMLYVDYAFTIEAGESLLSGGKVMPDSLTFRLVRNFG